MLHLCILVSVETIEAIKSHLLNALPNVKSSHRVEAAARGLGFRTYAALLQSAKSEKAISGPADGGKFTSYLSEHGFDVPAIYLYRAVAHVAVAAVMAKVPRLSMRGYGFGQPQWNLASKRWDNPQEEYARFSEARAKFLSNGGLEEFLLALALVQKIPPTRTIRSYAGSYKLKHIAENMPFVCEAMRLGPSYVSNGALIAAALHAGFKMKSYVDHLGYDHISVAFNMPKSVIDDLDCEMRPTGAVAQHRKRLAESKNSMLAYF